MTNLHSVCDGECHRRQKWGCEGSWGSSPALTCTCEVLLMRHIRPEGGCFPPLDDLFPEIAWRPWLVEQRDLQDSRLDFQVRHKKTLGLRGSDPWGEVGGLEVTHFEPMLSWWWSSVADAWPPSKQHWFNCVYLQSWCYSHHWPSPCDQTLAVLTGLDGQIGRNSGDCSCCHVWIKCTGIDTPCWIHFKSSSTHAVIHAAKRMKIT